MVSELEFKTTSLALTKQKTSQNESMQKIKRLEQVLKIKSQMSNQVIKKKQLNIDDDLD
jgi:hypothetical protein